MKAIEQLITHKAVSPKQEILVRFRYDDTGIPFHLYFKDEINVRNYLVNHPKEKNVSLERIEKVAI